jgi:hypothetical protein
MSDEERIEMLRRAFVQAHDVEAVYVESVPVKDTFQGQTVWEGIVDVFDIKGHPKTVRGYGWPYDIKNGEIQFTTVIAQPPKIISPLDAVRAFIHSQANKQP